MKKGPAQPADPFCDVSDLLVQTELLVELGHASAGIHQLLLAGEEGVVVSSVSNSRSLAGIPAPVIALSSVDLPALV